MVSSTPPPRQPPCGARRASARRRSSTSRSTNNSSTNNGRLDLRAARQELSDWIDWKSPENASTCADAELYTISLEQEQRILELLRTHITLASESFSDCRPLKNKYPPLAFLVEKNASLSCVQEVYHLFPPAIQYKDRWGNTPLHFACMARASAPVLEFLVHQDPTAIAMPNRVGYCPLHFILSGRSGRPLTRQHIDVLLPRAQQSLSMANDLGLTPLDLALKSNVSNGEALEYLFQVAAQTNTITSFAVPARTDDGRFGLKHARAVANLLPTLTSFSYTQCHGKLWTSKAFCHLLRAMGQPSLLEEIVLDVPRRILMTDPDAQLALQEMIASAPRLREVTLRNEERSGVANRITFNTNNVNNNNHNDDNYCKTDDEWIEALVRGFETNRTIETLVLYGVSLHNATPLLNLLSGPYQPRTLHLLGLGVTTMTTTTTDDDDTNATIRHNLSKCRCETIRLEGPNWHHDLLSHALGHMPRLVKVRIAYSGPSDLSTPLAALVERSPSLRQLEVSAGCCVKNPNALVAALQTNVTLETYTHAMNPDRISKARIAYYTNLNKYGRAHATQIANNCSKVEFVQLLCAAAEDEDLKPCWRQNDKFNIHFGLLSLFPSLWSDHGYGSMQRIGREDICL